MSAFVGIVQFDGRPVDADLLDRLTRHLRRIGPDTQNSRVLGRAGFGHALLKTTYESEHEQQPFSPRDDAMIVGDVRLDGRDELLHRLGGTHDRNGKDIPDIELVLHAWYRWGEELTDHLIGDFGFAIWDSVGKRLFAARDHMGIRTFYYHLSRDRLIFSNALNALLLDPLVTPALNELAVADFLVMGFNLDFTTTSFKDIQQLAPAHQVVFSQRGRNERQYWTLPAEGVDQDLRDDDIIDGFNHLLGQAVHDRMRCPRASILVSAGMDSTSVAAKASQWFEARGMQDGLLLSTRKPADDPHYREHLLVADFAAELALPLDTVDSSVRDYFDAELDSDWPAPEIFVHYARQVSATQLRGLAHHSPLALTGQGGDPSLKPSTSYFSKSLRRRGWAEHTRQLLAYLWMHRTVPPLRIHAKLRDRYEGPVEQQHVPNWINPELSQRLELPARYREHISSSYLRRLESHPTRPESLADLESVYWQYVLPQHDPQASGQPVEFRHPFFDIRLLKYLLGVASPRWFYRKAILRRAMAGHLPTYISDRPKHSFKVSEPKQTLLRMEPSTWHSMRRMSQEAQIYVDNDVYDRLGGELNLLTAREVAQFVRPIYLQRWIQTLGLS